MNEVQNPLQSLTKRYEHTMACYGHVLCNEAAFPLNSAQQNLSWEA